MVFLCTFLYLAIYGDKYASPMDSFSDSMVRHSGGGILGGLIGCLIVPGFGIIGAYVIDIIVMIVCLVLITGRSAMKGIKKSSKKVYDTAKESNEKYQERRRSARLEKKARGVSLDTQIKPHEDISTAEMGEVSLENYPEFPEVASESKVRLASGMTELIPDEAEPVSESPLPQVEIAPEPSPVEYDYHDPEPIPEPPVAERVKRKTKTTAREKEEAVADIKNEINHLQEKTSSGYVRPSIDILHKGAAGAAGNSQEQLVETSAKLIETLKIFGVNAKLLGYSCGPAVTRYEIQPELGVKVSKIVNLADDIKFALAATDVRIEAPIPGKSAVGIEVPNATNVTVPFRDLVESAEFNKMKSPITFGLGKDISGQIKVADLAKMPHLMIAGSTGSGKSVCINTIITSILYKAGPDEVKLIMIDPKVVELSVYNGIPHLLIPVVTDPKKAAGALNWAVAEMTERYNKFAQMGVREINGYNEKILSMEVEDGQERPEKMTRIVVIVDELADLMMVAAKDVEEAICRLAQLARAAGIHLIIATQRPSADVITGIIRANMPSRIAFAVSSAVDSRIILDQAGAERLLGKGDMLFNPQGASHPMRIQGAFITDDEISAIIEDVISKNGQAVSDEAFEEKISSMQSSSNSVSISDGEADDGRDSLFMEAARICVDKDKASIGMLQRYLKIGFNRAARIMDQLEEAGVVGPDLGTKPRTVLMDAQQFEEASL